MTSLMTTGGRTGLLAAVAGALAISVAPALAGGSLKDEPMTAEARQLAFSYNIGVTTDYVFRGISQSAENPAMQGGVDLTYGIFYAGIWGSRIDFGDNAPPARGTRAATLEVDLYAGIKPTWGPLSFDLGVIYYAYPGANDDAPAAGFLFRELDYVELKAGVSAAPFKNLTLGATVFYSPEYTSKQGEVWTLEGSAAYELPKLGIFTPTISALVGYQLGDFSAARFAAGQPTFVTANGRDDYLYWNAGVALAADKLTLDLRYWDTNIDSSGPVGAANFCTGATFQCDGRFVATAKIAF